MNNSIKISFSTLLMVACDVELPSPELDLDFEAEDEANDQNDGLAGVLNRHCVIRSHAVPVGEPVPEDLAPAEQTCFPRFADAVFFATGERLDPHASPLDYEPLPIASPNDTLAAYVIGVEFQHSWFGGSSLTFTSNVSCFGWYHTVAYVGNNWNDQISSARAYSGCGHSYHYEHANFGGSILDCRSECFYVGDAMNDRTSSLFWTQ
jgi:hypothetical protein